MLSDGEWKWTAELVLGLGWPVALAAGTWGYVRWRDRQMKRRLDDLDEAFAVWEQIDRELMITGHRLREDSEVAGLEEIPHGSDWDIPDGWMEAA